MYNFRNLLLPALIWLMGLAILVYFTLQLSENVSSKLRLESQEVSSQFKMALAMELKKASEDLRNLPGFYSNPPVAVDKLSSVAQKYVSDHSECSGIARVDKNLRFEWLNIVAMRPVEVDDLSLTPSALRKIREGQPVTARSRIRLRDFNLKDPLPNMDVSAVLFFVPLREDDPGAGGYLAFYKTQNFIDNAINSRVTSANFDQRAYGVEIADGDNIFFSRSADILKNQRVMLETQLIPEFDLRWRLTSWPTDQALERHDFWMPATVFGLGILAITILSFAVFSARFAHSRFSALKKEVRDRVAAEGKLFEAQTRFRAAVDHAIAPLFIAGIDGVIQDTNDAACEEFGFSRAELLGMDFWRLEATPRHSLLRDATENILSNDGKVRSIETRLRRKNGDQFDSEVRLGVVRVDELPCFVISATDLSERNRQRDHIRSLNQDLEKRVAERTEELYRLAAVLEASPDYVGVYEFPSGRPLFVNEAMRKLSGSGCPWFEEILPGNSCSAERVWRCLSRDFPRMVREGVWIGESTVSLSDQRMVPVSRLLQIHNGPDGSPRHVSAIMHDISARKRLEKELRNRGDSLESLNTSLARAARMKDEFLASMSHELRTPLNGILALSQSLLEEVYGPMNERQAGSLRDIEQCGKHLLSLITDVLDFSKIEAGQLGISKAPFDVSMVSQAAVKLVSQLAHQKQQKLRVNIDETIGQIDADPRRLKQMLVNLLGNAVKFTPVGGEIGLEVSQDPVRQEIRFTVWDTGIGIAPENLGRLFQPFQQLDSSLSREYSGTGLGLALVSRMADLHGGSVAVESEPGVGSRFSILIPHKTRSNPELLLSLEAGQSESRTVAVMLAEHDSRRVREFLEDTPVRVITLNHLGEWRQQILKTHPAVIMLDPESADEPGRLLLESLQAGEFPEVRSALVLTRPPGAGRQDPPPGGRIRLLQRAFDSAALRDALNGSPDANASTDLERRLPRYPTNEGPLILLAEDNSLNARIVKDWFEASGYRILLAQNGLLAVEMTIELMPELVIMDGQMPGLDGFQATQKLRENDLTRGIPIIALSALAMPGDRERWLAVGVEEYLSKPVSMNQLQSSVERTLMASRSVRPLEGKPNDSLLTGRSPNPSGRGLKERFAQP